MPAPGCIATWETGAACFCSTCTSERSPVSHTTTLPSSRPVATTLLSALHAEAVGRCGSCHVRGEGGPAQG